MKLQHCARFAAAATLFFVAAAQAQGDDWLVKVGVHTVDPKSDNGALAGGALRADVGSDTGVTISAERFVTPDWGVELLAALPFEHDVKLNGTKAATVKHLPPTASLQYHFNADGTISPFVGFGINYTTFFDAKTTGPLTGTKLSLSNTWGPAAHAGVDFRIDKHWLVSVDARWMKIDPDARVDGAKVGTVHIDPLAYGVAVGYRF